MRKNINDLIQWFSTYEISNRQAIFILVFSIILLFSPLLFFGKILLSADSTYYAYPVAYFFTHFFGTTINHFTFSGYPVADAFQIGYFHPLYNLIFRFFDFTFAYHLLLCIDLVGAGTFTYLFARKIGLSVYGALLAAIAYVFSQFAVAWSGVLSVANATFLLPFVLYSILQIVRLKRRFVLAFGLVVGIAFLGTHYQFIVMSLIFGVLLLGFEMSKTWKKENNIITNLKPFFFFFVGICLALVVSLPQAIHSLVFLGESTRAVILVYLETPHLDLFKYFIPTWNIPYVSMVEFRPYIGIVPLFFAIVGIWAVIRKRIQDKYASFFLWFFLITLVASLQYSPFIFIFKHIPFVKYFTDQSRWMYLGNFSLIILSGFGFDMILRNPASVSAGLTRFLKKLLIGLVIFFGSLNIGFLFLFDRINSFFKHYFDLYMYANTTHLPIQHYHDLIDLMTKQLFFNVSLSNLNVWLLVISVGGLYGLITLKNKRIIFSNLVVIFTVLIMLTIAMLSFDLGSQELLLRKSNLATFIQSREQNIYDYRVFGFSVPFGQYQKITALHPEASKESFIFSKEALMANVNIFSEIPVVGGYDPLAFRRYQDLVTYLEDTIARKTIEEKTLLFLEKLPLLSALSVKYIVSPYSLESEDLDLVFSENVTRFEVPLYLYQNKKVLPRLYLARNVTFLMDGAESENFKRVTEKGINFQSNTFVECNSCSSSLAQNIGRGKITLKTQKSDEFVVEVTSDSHEWLIFGTAAVPGWHATIDKVPVAIHYANHAYQAVWVPKGKHIVTFFYTLVPVFKNPIF